MRIKISSKNHNLIEYYIIFKDDSVIKRSVQKYTYAIHRYSVKIIELNTKSYWY